MKKLKFCTIFAALTLTLIFLPRLLETDIKKNNRSTAGIGFHNRSCSDLLKKLYDLQTSNSHLLLDPNKFRTNARWKRTGWKFSYPEGTKPTKPRKKPRSPPHHKEYGSSVGDYFRNYFKENPDKKREVLSFEPRDFDDPKFLIKAKKSLKEFLIINDENLRKIHSFSYRGRNIPQKMRDLNLAEDMVDRCAGVLMAKKIGFDLIGFPNGAIALAIKTDGTHPLNVTVKRLRQLYGENLNVLFYPSLMNPNSGRWVYENNAIYIGLSLIMDVGDSTYDDLIHEATHAFNTYSLLAGKKSPMYGLIYNGRKAYAKNTPKLKLPRAFLNGYGDLGFQFIDEMDAITRGKLKDIRNLALDPSYVDQVWQTRLIQNNNGNHFHHLWAHISNGSEVTERNLAVTKDVYKAMKKGVKPRFSVRKIGDQKIVYATMTIKTRKKNYVLEIPLIGGNTHWPDHNLNLFVNQINDLENLARKHQVFFHFLRLVYDKMSTVDKDGFVQILEALNKVLSRPRVSKDFPTLKELISKFNSEII